MGVELVAFAPFNTEAILSRVPDSEYQFPSHTAVGLVEILERRAASVGFEVFTAFAACEFGST